MDQDMDDIETHEQDQGCNYTQHVLPRVQTNGINLRDMDDDTFFSLMAHVPDPIQIGIKRREDSQGNVEEQPAEKLFRVDETMAPTLLDAEGYFVQHEVTKMETEAETVDASTQVNNLLTVPDYDPVPLGSPVKQARRRYSSSPQSKADFKLEFNGDEFDLQLSPRKKLEF